MSRSKALYEQALSKEKGQPVTLTPEQWAKLQGAGGSTSRDPSAYQGTLPTGPTRGPTEPKRVAPPPKGAESGFSGGTQESPDAVSYGVMSMNPIDMTKSQTVMGDGMNPRDTWQGYVAKHSPKPAPAPLPPRPATNGMYVTESGERPLTSSAYTATENGPVYNGPVVADAEQKPSFGQAVAAKGAGAWDSGQEQAFQKWYAARAAKLGLNPNPDDPAHHYDYRAAYRAGSEPGPDGHWDSRFKAPDHPNRYVDGYDTITGEKIGK